MKVTTVEEFYGNQRIVEREVTNIDLGEDFASLSVCGVHIDCTKDRVTDELIPLHFSLIEIYTVREAYKEAIEKLGRACVRSHHKIIQDYGKHLLAYTGPPMRFKYMHRDYMQSIQPNYNPEDQFYIGRLLSLKKFLPKYVEKFIDLLAI